MSLRTRLSLAFALVATIVAALVGLLSFWVVADRLDGELDQALQAATVSLADGRTEVLAPAPTGSLADRDGAGVRWVPLDAGRRGENQRLVAQAVAPDGTMTRLGGFDALLPVGATARTLAASAVTGESAMSEVELGDTDLRVLTTALGDGRGALQVAVDVTRPDRVLVEMAVAIGLISGAVLLVAAAVGWVIARRITHPLVRLTAVAEDISADGRVEAVEIHGAGNGPPGRDEVGRLAASFTAMLARIANARDAQDRLVQDAAHELRTPLTSLRTNASVLRRVAEVTPEARERLIDDLQSETRELSNLVEELVELALARRSDEQEEAVALADVVDRVVDRVRRRAPRRIVVDSDGSVVLGQPHGLERAVGNLVENAAKFAPDDAGPIEVHVELGSVVVSDRGPGIDECDAARVFDRFYRSDAARALPGSGLGLSIVHDVAAAHDGHAFARPRPGGGAVVGFGVAPDRLLPDSERGHVGTSPAVGTVDDN
ncbi:MULTISPECIES: sensor histidine kinase [Pseudonocardia]|uniref:histidine kinase n=2 Tax=Pseudonocardia TaxID=1847 RepID=A0A1Y2N5P3_PSEAH|nr:MULTISPECIES: ATP-binding protein [Pseudonocardia]OSY42766.1 Signal transduction histidine-protein kinase/phosphatase MprB [Pseudonocardia autotrophica]TDN77343.1 two-component system sensor histidine kinase MprB [Pseudonocardia autotrophica]BBG01365.1 two-component sensor histidine kinase [Pseudonocardia autotrophica]GEC24421.1 two-component sensor histidine kinase [Pseudonocardia saturnea]